MSNRVFHTATIGGLEFQALMASDGPYLACAKPLGGVSLGVCQIRHFEPDYHIAGPKGWYVVKYDSESSIDIHHFSEQQALELANEFGINMWDFRKFGNHSEAAFYQGKAWEGLKEWVKSHPRIAKQVIQHKQYYLPGWYKRALGFEPILIHEPSPAERRLLLGSL